jgi:glucokinase
MKYSVGLDLGGTKLASALVDASGKVISFRKESILSIKNDPGKIVDLMVQVVDDFRKKSPQAFRKGAFQGVGLACAGPLNVETGSLVYPINFPGWKIVPIQKKLSSALKKRGLPAAVFFQNDAVAAALAEGWIGGAEGMKNYAVITVGTGIGTGVIFSGRPVQYKGMGSEFGHLIINAQNIHLSDDLHPNTVEGIASGTGMLRRAKQMGFTGATVEELVLELEKGNLRWQKLFDDTADSLAALCYNLSIGFNLEKILFSGGLIKVRNLYFPRVKKRYEDFVNEMNPLFKCPLEVARCLNKAGVIGAAYLPFQ